MMKKVEHLKNQVLYITNSTYDRLHSSNECYDEKTKEFNEKRDVEEIHDFE